MIKSRLIHLLLIWLQDRSSKNERDMRSFKKRLSKYNSAKEAIVSDPFFSNLLVVWINCLQVVTYLGR
jgi:hypothetical protein